MTASRPLGADWFLCDPEAVDAYPHLGDRRGDGFEDPGEVGVPEEDGPVQLELFEDAHPGSGAGATCP